MCNIVGGYFTINGVEPYQKTCSTSVTSIIGVQLRVTFPYSDVGKNFKAIMEINTPSGIKRASTGFQQVIGVTTFDLSFVDFGIHYLHTGEKYDTLLFQVLDSSDIVVCQGSGKNSGICESLTIGYGTECKCDTSKEICISNKCISKLFLSVSSVVGIAILYLILSHSQHNET